MYYSCLEKALTKNNKCKLNLPCKYKKPYDNNCCCVCNKLESCELVCMDLIKEDKMFTDCQKPFRVKDLKKHLENMDDNLLIMLHTTGNEFKYLSLIGCNNYEVTLLFQPENYFKELE